MHNLSATLQTSWRRPESDSVEIMEERISRPRLPAMLIALGGESRRKREEFRSGAALCTGAARRYVRERRGVSPPVVTGDLTVRRSW